MNHPRKHVEAFVDTLSKEMLAFCGPIFITPGLLTYPDQMVDNGTYSLIYTGQKHLLVTCHHVWQKYLDYPKIQMQSWQSISETVMRALRLFAQSSS